jgi:hypothetical protein
VKKAITLAAVLDAKKRLESLPKIENAKRVITTREAVQILKKQITELRSKGYSLVQIAEELSKQGIEVKESTLRLYRKPGNQRHSGSRKNGSEEKHSFRSAGDSVATETPAEPAGRRV